MFSTYFVTFARSSSLVSVYVSCSLSLLPVIIKKILLQLWPHSISYVNSLSLSLSINLQKVLLRQALLMMRVQVYFFLCEFFFINICNFYLMYFVAQASIIFIVSYLIFFFPGERKFWNYLNFKKIFFMHDKYVFLFLKRLAGHKKP